ncbi:NACHT domain- and WD repeat-containing protein 1-like [Frankliniella occidentalis]|uniref:NACHT domain- and WD repeat-containing protein 1-like n=1 Tax=Frankliniella occidentalis TaxID=133901 RepID=A0A9C6UA15_FRAOC|nr:NACHT domain- and WD repeat-containing protein 1-like [Frankliniella occidentalis]
MRRLVLGRHSNTRSTDRSNKIAIYVCAADSQDCCVEKGALHRHVYPELRAACRARGYELHIVDLHWRTPLEKQQDHQFPELCLGELARQQETAYVVPVLFLNMSLGTPLLPNTIETQDFEMALGKADDKTLLNKWYSLDSHAQPPCYRLRPTTCHIPGLREDREGALSEWQAEIERTLAVLQSVLPTELRDTYLSTALEQEVHNTVCMSQEMARRTLWLHRVYTHQPPAAPAAAPSAQETELRRRLDSIHQILKSQLVEKHILRLSVKYSDGGLQPELPEHAQYVAEVTAQLTNSLRGIVDAIIDEDMAKTVGKPGFGLDNRLMQELTHQASVCQQASQCSVNRDYILSEIKSYVEGGSRAPLVVTGPRGCGKSTLVARAAQCCASWAGSAAAAGSGSGPPLLALRFCGVSADSMTLERVLASIGHQCQLLCDGGHCWASHSVDSWKQQLPDLLAGAAAKRTLVVMVDGLDQLKSYGALVTDWVPAELPVNVKLVVTLWEGSPLLGELKEKSTVIQMPKLDQAEAASILNAWVMQYNHSVPKRVQDSVLASVRDCTLPLYAKLLAWQTSWEWEQEVTPRGNVDDQLHHLLDQLEAILGKEQVAYGVALLCVAKYGVSDSEMLDLLAHDPIFHSSSTHVAWAPACLFWARLNKLLAPFLQWVMCGDELVLQWRDATIRAAVEARYLDKNAKAKAAKALLFYFKGSWWSDRSPALLGRLQPMPNLADKCYNARRLQELPFVSHAVNGSIKQDYLLDLAWVYDKVCGADVFQVLEDIALERSNDADVQWLAKALREAAPALAFDGRQLHSQLFP